MSFLIEYCRKIVEHFKEIEIICQIHHFIYNMLRQNQISFFLTAKKVKENEICSSFNHEILLKLYGVICINTKEVNPT